MLIRQIVDWFWTAFVEHIFSILFLGLKSNKRINCVNRRIKLKTAAAANAILFIPEILNIAATAKLNFLNFVK